MLNDSLLEEWFGLPVELAGSDTEFDAARKTYRFAFSYDTEAEPLGVFERFLESDEAGKAKAIIFGMDSECGSDTTQSQFVDLLEVHKNKLTSLRGLFFGDIAQEENEMSWIKQDDVSRALGIFPNLQELRARGQDGLQFKGCWHEHLQTLVIETGGMPREVLQGIATSCFPALERLVLWLGTDEYGFDGSVEDIQPLLESGVFPNLRHLTLGNSDIADDIASALIGAPVLDQLETLDLSLGTMTDAGARELLKNPAIARLKSLNLRRNFISKEAASEFSKLGLPVDTTEQEEADTYNGETHYYVAVGE